MLSLKKKKKKQTMYKSVETVKYQNVISIKMRCPIVIWSLAFLFFLKRGCLSNHGDLERRKRKESIEAIIHRHARETLSISKLS